MLSLIPGEFKEADRKDASIHLDNLKKLRKDRMVKAKLNERLLVPKGQKAGFGTTEGHNCLCRC